MRRGTNGSTDVRPHGVQGESVVVPIDAVRRLMGRNDELTLATEDLVESVGRMGDASRDTARAADVAGAATGRVGDEASSVATAVGQMSAAMQDVASSATEAIGVTAEAAEATREVRASVERLMASTAHIHGVVDTVAGISSQTRMLALNATIEAARAGSAGRGFAVVAEEVKNLAAQTGDATNLITAQLADLAADSDAVRSAVERIDEVLARVDALQQTIAAAVEQQTSAITEITRSASQVAEAAADLDASVTTSVAAARTSEESMARSRTWLERVEAAAGAQRDEIAGLGSGVEPHPLRAAIVAHAGWKKRLRAAIDTGRLPAGVTVASAARDDACACGIWLRSSESAALDQARCTTVRAQHATFHRAAADVLSAATSGRRDRAVELMASPDAYGGAASALTDALVEWVGVVESGARRRS